MRKQVQQKRRQLRLPSLFLPSLAILFFCVASGLVVWQLHGKPYDDLPSFYWATKVAFEQIASPYQRENFQPLEQGFHQKIYPFLYPPPSLVLFTPFLLCESYSQCKSVFSLLNLFLWWVIVWQLFQLCRHLLQGRLSSASTLAVIALATLFYLPLVDTIKNGQVNLLVLACLLPLMIPASGRLHAWITGALLACAILLKVYVLLLIPVLLVFARWRVVLAALVVLSCLVALGAALLPSGLWSDWLALSRSAGYGRGVPGVLTIPFNQSINGFFIRMFLDERGLGSDTTWILWIYLVITACVLTAAYVTMVFLRCREKGQSIAIAMALLLINLVAPLSWLHHYVLALPAALCSVVLVYGHPAAGDGLRRVALAGCLVGLAAPYAVTGVLALMPSAPAHIGGASLWPNLAQSVTLLAGLGAFLILASSGSRGETAPRRRSAE